MSFIRPLYVTVALFFVLSSPLRIASAAPVVTGNQKTDNGPLAALESGVKRFQLSNGLRVVFYRREIGPVFSGEVWVKVGGVDENPGQTGIAHFLEHMAFKGGERIGTKDYGTEKLLLDKLEAKIVAAKDQAAVLASPEIQDLYKQLSALWIDNEFGRIYATAGGVGLNAQTAKDYTSYEVSLPNIAFEMWCWMESERLLRPVFRQFYREREVVQEERRMNFDDDPQGKAYEALLDLAYTTHPYRYPNIGYSKDLKTITETQMRAFWERYYRADNIVLSIVGNLPDDQVEELVEKYFSRLPKMDGEIPDVSAVEPAQTDFRRAVIRVDAEPSFLIGYHKPVWPNRDDAQFSVLHGVLSEVRSSILQREFIQKRRIAVSVDTSEAPGTRFPSLFLVSASPARGVANETLRKEIQLAIDRVGTEEISQQTLDAAKRREKVSLLQALDSNDDLAQMLGMSELLWDDPLAVVKMYQTVEETTAADLKRLVRTYLNESQSTFIDVEKKK